MACTDSRHEAGQQPAICAPAPSHAVYDNAAYEATNVDDTRKDSTSPEEINPSNGEVKKPPTRTKPKQDSGYAWVILVLSALTCIVYSNGESITGVLLVELGHVFNVGAVELNAATTLSLGITECSSMFSGLFVSRFGSKITVIIGSILATVGYVGISFAPNIYVIMVAFGIVTGTGFGFLQMGAVFPLYEYFDKRKGLAMGVFAASYGVSQFLWPPVATVLFNYYGWRGTFLIMAGIQLNVCIVGALMRPFPKDKDDTQYDSNKSGDSYLKAQLKVFKNKTFVAYCGTLIIVYSAYSYAYAYLPTLAVKIGASETNAALLVSMFGVCGGVSCLICGFIADAPWFRNNRLVICIIAITLSGIDKIVSTKAATYVHLAVFAVADGLTTGAFGSMFFTIISDLVSEEHQGLAGGIGSFCAGLGLLIGNPATGWMYSHYGSLVVPAVVMGCVQTLGAVLTTLLYIYIKYKDNKSYTITVL